MRSIQQCRAGLAAIVLFVSVSGSAQNTLGYDPAADPFALLSAARSAAAAEDKLILVVAGGEWCIWCHYLNAFLADNPGITKALKDTFVVVKAYIGDETDNDAFFSTLPAAAGYPHFWVLGADGEVLQSQDTLPLEDGDKSYEKGEFIAFIDNWKQAR
jgi:hypothetical protein